MTIADNGTVTIINNVRMSIAEITDLFEIYYQTRNISDLLRNRVLLPEIIQ